MIRCSNCREGIPDTNLTRNASAVVWFLCCRACADLARVQMEPLEPLPGQPAHLEILRCRSCGLTRSNVKGWKKHCHVCVDERAIPNDLAGNLTRPSFRRSAEIRRWVDLVVRYQR